MALSDAFKDYKQAKAETESLKNQITELVGQVEAKRQELENIVAEANQKREATQASLDSTNTIQTNIATVLDDVQSKQELINNKLAEAQEIQNRLNDAEVSLKQSQEDLLALEKLAKHNSELTSDLLQKAAAGKLFEAFGKVKEEHTEEAGFWRWSIIVSLVILGIIACYFVFTTKVFGVTYWVSKLAVSSPVIYWLILSTRRYSKAKRFEEEYAFRGAVSLSLEAYKDLIKQEADSNTKETVVPFLVESINGIYTSPAESLSKHPHKEDKDILETVAETAKSLADTINKKIP